MAAVSYKCLGCGAYLTDEEGKDILVCPRCGTTVTKKISDYDKTLRYLKEKDEREAAEQRRQTDHAWLETKHAKWILFGIVFLGLLYMFLRDKIGIF